jgi:uncharacterized protein
MHIGGKLVLITGASSGIGKATAKAVAAKGGRVILTARNKELLDAVAAEIAREGAEASIYQADLSDRAAIRTLADRIHVERGVPDILINNAGAGRWVTVQETEPGEAEQMMGLPYFAAFNLTRELLPGMLARGSGHIVNVTSVASRMVWPGATAYTAARWAMNGFNDALRTELHGTGIKVTLAMLGKVKSEYWAHNPGSEARLPAINRYIPVLTPEDAANAIVRGIERGAREAIRPALVRVPLLLNMLFPRITESIMRMGWKGA